MKFYTAIFLILISTAVMAQYPVMVSPPDTMTNAPTTTRFSWLPMRMATQYQINISQTPLLATDTEVNPANLNSISVHRIDSKYNTKTELFLSNLLLNGISATFLLNGTYYWHIRATNDVYSAATFPPNANWTAWSPTRSFTVHAGTPTVVAPYTTAKLISATPRFQWSPVRDASTYQLYISTNADMSNPVYQIITTNTYVDFSTPLYYAGTAPNFTYQATPLTTSTMGPLRLGQTYYWYVNVTNSVALNSAVYSFTTFGGAPTTLAPRNNASITSVQPTFLWTSVKGASQYRFMLTTNADVNFATPLVTVTVNSVTNYTLTATQKLMIGRTYRWRVQALNSNTPITDTQSRSTVVIFNTY